MPNIDLKIQQAEPYFNPYTKPVDEKRRGETANIIVAIQDVPLILELYREWAAEQKSKGIDVPETLELT